MQTVRVTIHLFKNEGKKSVTGIKLVAKLKKSLMEERRIDFIYITSLKKADFPQK